jgi:MFS family permease
MTDIQSNIGKIYAFKFLSEFYLIAPILIPYYISHQLSSTQIFIIQAVYALAILLFEIPSGYLADVIGRKKTLILGAAAFPLGIAVYAFTGTFWLFILAEVILAVANSMRSGCDTALVYDTLLELDQASEYTRFEGRAFVFTRIGTSASSVLGGLAALAALRLPFYVNIGTASLMLPLALLLKEPEREALKAQNPLRDILRICRSTFRDARLRLLMLYSALILSTGVVGVWAYFFYYESLGISIGWFGVLFALFQLSSAWGSSNAHRAQRRLGTHVSLFLTMGIALNLLLIGIFRSAFLIPLIFLNAFLWGFSYPIFMDLLNRQIASNIRATVLSVANMTGSLSYVLLAPVFGKLVDTMSLGPSFVLLGGYFALYGSAAFWWLMRLFPRQHNSD